MHRAVVIADTHIGSSVAPWPKQQPLADGGRWVPNIYQRWLNRCFQQMLKDVTALRPQTIVFLGDMVQGASPRDGQIVTNRIGLQCQAATKLLKPLAQSGAKLYYVRGTEWHEGMSSTSVDEMAEALGCVPHPTTGSSTWRRLYLDMDGHIVDFMHHIGCGASAQASANAPLRDAVNHQAELVLKYGRKAPIIKASIRAHRHKYVQAEIDGIQAATCPAWQLGTAFTDAKGNVTLSDIGWLSIEASKDGLRIDKHLYPLALPHIEVA